MMHIGLVPVYYAFWPNSILNTMEKYYFFQFVKLNELSGQILPHLVLSSIEQGEGQTANLLPTDLCTKYVKIIRKENLFFSSRIITLSNKVSA